MAFANVLDAESFAMAFAPQSSGLQVAGSAWVWFEGTMPQVQIEKSTNETRRSVGARGAGTKRKTGRRWYRITTSVPLHGQPSTYDPTVGSPAAYNVGALHFLAHLGAGISVTYALNGVSPVAADANTVNLTGAAKNGCLLAYGDGGATPKTVRGMGFVKDAATPATTQLFEDVGVIPAATDERWPTITYIPSATQPEPFTFRIVGEPTNQDLRFVGCHVSKLTPRVDGERLWLDVEFVAYAGRTETTSGGLVRPARYLSLDPVLARGGARLVIGSQVIATLNDGTADPTGSCDIRDLATTFEIPHRPVRCDSANEGVSEVTMLSPRISGSLWCPKVSDYEVSGRNIFEAAWEDETSLSLSFYLGDRPGCVFAWQLTAANITDYNFAVNERAMGFNVSFEAGDDWIGDGASTDAGNTVSRVALG